MDIVFVYNYTSKLKFVLPIKHLHQICPVDVFANIAGDYPIPGPVYSRLRHFEGEAEQLRLRAYTTNDRKSTCSSVSALLMYFSDFRPGIISVIIANKTQVPLSHRNCEMLERTARN